ncbi:hypothetical protein EDB84DRAFT_1478375 [Lactarius hengduanensis]|nr:hypothetical protein EDB84DRAFT_1478375 [Lactarius hengduanensis]
MPLKTASVPRSPSSPCSPYPSSAARRTSSQPKSSRQQFSACGACRMRRVRCDLKDLPFSSTGTQPQCSNCKERGLKCVDEFAEVKAVKLLRRGRRLQQVEAVYGKSMDEEGGLFTAPTLSPGLIPKLQPEFFSSPFFRRFHIQHPIIDPSEFCARFFEFSKGNYNALGVPGQLIATLLAVWAASFGVNEYGIEELHHGEAVIRNRREATNEMVLEMLQLIDVHGILRKPTWDGVRALHLLLPLTQEIQSPMERLVMYEAMVSQVFTLCSLASVSSVGSGQGQAVDTLVRARLFWYSHIVEGVTSGLRGGRLLISDDDLTSFQKTLPPLDSDAMTRASTVAYEFTYRYAMVPLELASACRKVHAALTGPKARQQNEIDEKSLHDVWDALEKLWKDFDNLRMLGTSGNVHEEDVDRYIHGWQIFIFECLNVIREALKQRTVVHPNRDRSLSNAHNSSPRSPPLDAATRLLKIADARCHEVVRRVIVIIRQHLGTPLFEYDASLVRDGCFFAGFLLAGEGGSDEDVQICLQALRQMRWAFSKSEEREKTVRMVWESRKGSSARPSSLSTPVFELQPAGTHFLRNHSLRPLPPPLSIPSLSSTSGLSMLDTSAPTTACTEDGSWASPLSATSSSPHSPIENPLISGSTGGSPSSTLVSSNGSPPFFALAQGPTPFSQMSSGIKSDSQRHSPPLMFYPCTDTGHYTFTTPPPSAGGLSALTNTQPSSSSVGQVRSSILSPSPTSHNTIQDDVDAAYNHPSPTSFFDTSSVVYPMGGTSPSALHSGSTLDHTFSLSSSFF